MQSSGASTKQKTTPFRPSSFTQPNHRPLRTVAFAVGFMLCITAASPADSPYQMTIKARHKILRQFDDVVDAAIGSEPDRDEQLRLFAWRYQGDPSRSYFAVPQANQPDAARDASLLDARKRVAAALIEEARSAVAREDSVGAYQLLRDALLFDPTHEQALRWTGSETELGEPEIQRIPRRHPKYRWAAGEYLLANTNRFHIATNCDEATAKRIGAALERLRAVWEQMFFESWMFAPNLKATISGSGNATPRRRGRHRVVLFRTREEYLAVLSQLEPQAAQTKGYYHTGSRTSYFYLRDENNESTWYHEATHQLFHEAARASRRVGTRSDFWIVEGVAMYLESLQPCGQWFCTGGVEADRLQFARFRALREGFFIPIEQLTQLSQEEVQRHPRIGALYSQAAGVTQFLMHHPNGISTRTRLQEYLRDVYRGQRNPANIAERLDTTEEALNRDYLSFLRCNNESLQQLDSRITIRKLCLGNCPITDDGLQKLPDTTHLTWLDLAGTSVTDQGTTFLARATSLRQATFEKTGIGNETVVRLANANQLIELDLSGTRISNQAIPMVAGLSHLNRLWLTGTRVTDDAVPNLLSLNRLRLLELSSTEITAAGRARLKDGLKEAKITP